jgi:peptidylprolyl isomerase
MSDQLQITEIIVGDGKETVKGALLVVHYDGYLEDGTKFDSSRDKGVPFRFVFGTGRVIKGWDQGLVGMKVGGQRELVVPAHLAYGDRKVGDLIPANSNLMFEVELLEVLVRG